MRNPKKPNPAPETEAGLEDLLEETRRFDPPAAFRGAALVTDPAVYDQAEKDPLAFWESHARELQWIKPWDTVLTGEGPDARWFVGGKINASVNCLDRHVAGPHRNKAALIWEGEPGDRRTWTYFDLWREVSNVRGMASVLNNLGLIARRRGDHETARTHLNQALEVGRRTQEGLEIEGTALQAFVLSHRHHDHGVSTMAGHDLGTVP